MEDAELCSSAGPDESVPAEVDAEGSVTTPDGVFGEYPNGLEATSTEVATPDPDVFAGGDRTGGGAAGQLAGTEPEAMTCPPCAVGVGLFTSTCQ